MIEHSVGSYSIDPLPAFVSIGNYSSVAANCYFHHEDNHACVENRSLVATGNQWGCSGKGHITIGNDVWIGYGVSILDGVTIGNGAIVGAHSVVSKDVDPFSVVVGNPARFARYRFPLPQCAQLEKIAWWLWPEERFDARKEDFQDITTFIEKYL